MTDEAKSARPSAVPVVETDRLRLRAHTSADYPVSAAMWADADVTRFIGGRPFTAEESWMRVLRCAGHWALNGYGFWVVEERATGKFLGEAGFMDFKRGFEPPVVDMRPSWTCPRPAGPSFAKPTAAATPPKPSAH
jgi:RimJ/RimL family protein N-acetyltransferase